jgi:SAM-dependent methyltransferase
MWPWLTAEANSCLASFLQPDHRVLEFGAGGSTVFFARRAGKVCSVEGNPEWSSKVRGWLKEYELEDKVELCSEAQFNVDGVGDDFDLILVDGGDRLRHAEESLEMLRPGGWLVVDNINRYVPNTSPGPGSVREWDPGNPEQGGWKAWWEWVADWEKKWTGNGVIDTLILIKPAKGSENPNGAGSTFDEGTLGCHGGDSREV